MNDLKSQEVQGAVLLYVVDAVLFYTAASSEFLMATISQDTGSVFGWFRCNYLIANYEKKKCFLLNATEIACTNGQLHRLWSV